MGVKDAPGKTDHLAKDQLHDAAAIGDGVIHDEDASASAGGLVHGVIADAAEHDGGEVLGGGEHAVIDLKAAALVDEVVLAFLQAREHGVHVLGHGGGQALGLDALRAQILIQGGIGALQDESFLEATIEEADIILNGHDTKTLSEKTGRAGRDVLTQKRAPRKARGVWQGELRRPRSPRILQRWSAAHPRSHRA